MLDKHERPVYKPDYTPGHSFAAGSGIRRKRPCTTRGSQEVSHAPAVVSQGKEWEWVEGMLG